ncbi:hypothetical protein MHU86_11909 [Fragilaria crotonensis]|nr:hypothetical protein MHU86_11909 [Fragilaria crotonensis]
MQRKQSSATTKGHRPCCNQHAEEIGKPMSTSKFLNRVKVLVALHPARIGMLCALLVLLLLVTNMLPQPEHTIGDEVQKPIVHTNSFKSQQHPVSPKPLPDLSKYDNCTLPIPPASSRSSWTTKPLWFPSYPNSIDDNILKSAIASLTGLNAGAKSFYASSRAMGLRHCIGRTETVSCLNIHPMVLMKPDPTSKTNIFASPIVYILRNPATAMPAFMNQKRIKYAKLPGQTPLEEWQSSRDQFLSTGLFEGYVNQLRTWHDYTTSSSSSTATSTTSTTTTSSSYYTMGMYLVWEHWMDPERGPAELVRLARLLSTVGFPILMDDDSDLTMATCVWYRSIGGKEALERYHKYHRYDFQDYLPGYTKEQKDMMLDGLAKLMKDYSSDTELVGILKDYADTIQEYPNDEKWVNQTAKS